MIPSLGAGAGATVLDIIIGWLTSEMEKNVNDQNKMAKKNHECKNKGRENPRPVVC